MKPVTLDAARSEPERKPLPTPLLLPAIGLMAGIALDNLIAIPRIVCVAIVVAAVLLVMRRGSATWVGMGVILAAVGLGAARHDLAFRRWPANHVARLVGSAPTLGTIRGTIIDGPIVASRDAGRGLPRYAAGAQTRFVVDTIALIDTAGATHGVSGRAAVHVGAGVAGVQPGDVVEVFGLLGRVPGPANPGEFDRRLALRRDGILVQVSANTPEAVRVVARPASAGPRRWLAAARRVLSAALRQTGSGAADESAGSVADAMVLAQRSRVERTINEAYQRTGNSHLLAASGLNVAWLALFVWMIGFALNLHYRTTTLLVLLTLAAYGVVAEPNPPILRAVIMGAAACAAVLMRRRVNVVNWLAAAAIVLLLFNPCLLFAASFQLTFAVVVGLVVLSRRVLNPIERAQLAAAGLSPMPDDVAASSANSVLRAAGWWQALIDLVGAGSMCALAAWLSGLPLAAYWFGAIAPWGFITSFVLAPLAGLVTILGFVKLVLAFVLPPSVAATGPMLNGVIWLMNWLVRRFAEIPGTYVQVGRPHVIWVVACYLLLGLAVVWNRSVVKAWREKLRIGRGAIIVAAIGLLAWPFVPMQRWMRPGDAVKVWTLAVGNGTATVLELPDGRTLLYDCGSRSPVDVAERTVVPFLRQRGIGAIDAAFVSHPDADHFSGIEGVARAMPIRRLLINEHFEDFGADQPEAMAMLRRVGELGIPIERIRSGWKLTGGGAEVECVWPPPAGAYMTSDNSSSTVVRVTFGGRRMLLPGDIDNYALDQLTAAGGIGCDVLQLPHHGGVTNSTEAFLAAANPIVCIRSSGQRERETVNGIQRLVGAREYFSTAEDGCVEVTLRADGVRVEGYRRAAEAAGAP